MTELDTGLEADPIPRDRNGWPIVPDPARPGETLKCLRPSSIAKKYLTDSFTLNQWQKRTIIKGAGLRPDLGQAAGPLDLSADSRALNDLAAEAAVAGGAAAKANRGTAVHSVVEKVLQGVDVDVPPDLAGDVAAIRRCLDENDVRLFGDWCERFVINETVPAAGSADAYVTAAGVDGVVVLDLKTGGDPRQFSRLLEYGAQMAIYARAGWGWRGAGHDLERAPDLNRDVGLILWAPAGEGRAELVGVDLAEGWRMVELAMAVREARKNPKRMHVELAAAAADTEADGNTIGSTRYVDDTSEPRGRRAALRRRLRWLTDHTECTVDDIKAGWPEGVPPLTVDGHTDAQLEALETLARLAEVRFGAELADPARVAAAVAAVDALPADLVAEVTEEAKAGPTPVPNLGGRDVRTLHLDVLAPLVSSAAATHRGRVAAVSDALSGFPDDEATGIVEWATETDGPTGRDMLTGLQADRVVALAAMYRAGVDDLEGALLERHGSKRAVVDAGKAAADVHGLPRPKSAADVAADRVLASLVLR